MRTILFLLIAVSCHAQVSQKHWIAGGKNTGHHYENCKRAMAGTYGKAIDCKTRFKIDMPLRVFGVYEDNATRSGYRYFKRMKSLEPGVERYVVFSEEDNELQYVTISDSFLIIYKYSKQTMYIYRLK